MIKINLITVKQEFPDVNTRPFGNMYIKAFRFPNKFASSKEVFERYVNNVRVQHLSRFVEIPVEPYYDENGDKKNTKKLKTIAVDFVFENQDTEFSKPYFLIEKLKLDMRKSDMSINDIQKRINEIRGNFIVFRGENSHISKTAKDHAEKEISGIENRIKNLKQ
jgi:hypothetical protein